MEGPPPKESKRPINVCLSNVIKSLKCDHPCSEGYEVRNLISSNLLERNKGFLVERFIKPPVNVTFEFIGEIDLRYILVQCNVGAQKTSGIELSIQTNSNEQFESVSSGILKETQKGFIFHRHSERVQRKYGDNFCFRSLKYSRFLSVVKSVRLKIFRTVGSSVPALSKIEIWAVPHKHVLGLMVKCGKTNTECDNLSRTAGQVKEDEIKNKALAFMRGHEKKISCSRCPTINNIPEDFIDPITCEIMCQPITLPSGKIIDHSTLESYEKAESKWGRGPSDPFTGILFTNSSKPIAASDLKARIDKFLCDNSNNPEFLKIPRTVGRGSSSCLTANSRSSVSKLLSCEGQTSVCRMSKNPSLKDRQSYNSAKRAKFEETNDQYCKMQLGLNLHKREVSAKTTSVVNCSVLSSSTSTNGPGLSFQERMEKSLELSLKSTLSSFPTFTADEEECNAKPQVECNSCKSCDNLFSIPCRHFVCRKCLVNLKTKLICSFCKSSFKSHEVQRIHTEQNKVLNPKNAHFSF